MGTAKIEVVPVAGRIGAEIRGVRLSGDLDAETVHAIRSAWLRHKVVFFRGQTHLDDRSQEALTPIFGAGPISHPLATATAQSIPYQNFVAIDLSAPPSVANLLIASRSRAGTSGQGESIPIVRAEGKIKFARQSGVPGTANWCPVLSLSSYGPARGRCRDSRLRRGRSSCSM
jgi:hypothetical protein